MPPRLRLSAAAGCLLAFAGASLAFANNVAVTDTKDTRGNPLDIAVAGAGHTSATKLNFAIRTHGNLPTSKTANILVGIDVPGGRPKGQRGGPQGDYQILGNRLQNTRNFRTAGAVTRTRLDAKTIVFSFAASAIGNPATFDWFVSTGCPERACRSDYAPNQGWKRHRLR